jgi:hypothetical protein
MSQNTLQSASAESYFLEKCLVVARLAGVSVSK